MAWKPNYASVRNENRHWTYDKFVKEVLDTKEHTVQFLMNCGVLKAKHDCPKCFKEMKLTRCSAKDFIEECCFRCQRSHFDMESGGELEAVTEDFCGCKQGGILGNPVADGWAGAVMRKPLLFINLIDGRTDRHGKV